MSRLLPVLLMLTMLSACAAPDDVSYTSTERRIMLTVNFDFDSHTIRPDGYQVLDNLSAALVNERLRGVTFEINGHTDIVGRLGYNLGLSMLRAGAVVDYLAARGVPGNAMRAQGFGPLRLADPNNPASGVNRRVEVVAVGP